METREGAVGTLGKITAQKNALRITDASLVTIKRALLQVAEDKTSPARKPAIEGLMPIPDSDVRVVMARLATDTTPSRKVLKGPISYPVRDAARRLATRSRALAGSEV